MNPLPPRKIRKVGTILKADSFAERIVRQRRIEAQKPQLSDEDTKKAAIRLINARVRSAGFIASGWLPAFNALKKLTRGDSSPFVDLNSAHVKGQPKGYATPATPGQSKVVGEIGNSVDGADQWPGGNAGLQASVDFVARDMLEFALKELIRQGKAAGLDVRGV